MYKSNFTYDWPDVSLTDPLKHIHSAIVLTPLQLMLQDWTYFERIMLQY